MQRTAHMKVTQAEDGRQRQMGIRDIGYPAQRLLNRYQTRQAPRLLAGIGCCPGGPPKPNGKSPGPNHFPPFPDRVHQRLGLMVCPPERNLPNRLGILSGSIPGSKSMGANSEGSVASARASCRRVSRNRFIRPAVSPKDRRVECDSPGEFPLGRTPVAPARGRGGGGG